MCQHGPAEGGHGRHYCVACSSAAPPPPPSADSPEHTQSYCSLTRRSWRERESAGSHFLPIPSCRRCECTARPPCRQVESSVCLSGTRQVQPFLKRKAKQSNQRRECINSWSEKEMLAKTVLRAGGRAGGRCRLLADAQCGTLLRSSSYNRPRYALFSTLDRPKPPSRGTCPRPPFLAPNAFPSIE